VRLLGDSRVPTTEKALVAGAIIYAVIPFDLIPDMIPFVGQLDDAYLIAMTLLRLMDRTIPWSCAPIGMRRRYCAVDRGDGHALREVPAKEIRRVSFASHSGGAERKGQLLPMPLL